MSGVGVLDKAVVILAACVDGASLAELVERTKLPRATAHRLAQALEIHRMLVRDQQGRWRPGPRLGELANAAPDVLLTTNIACRIHLGNGLKARADVVPVLHPLALLAQQLDNRPS